jgi:hypothetical protein
MASTCAACNQVNWRASTFMITCRRVIARTSRRCLVNVPIAAEENVYPMVPPGGANRDMIGGEFDDAKPA